MTRPQHAKRIHAPGRWLAAFVASALCLGIGAHPRWGRGGADEHPAVRPEPPPAAPLHFQDRIDTTLFYRGSVHSHSAVSDGDSPAAMVIAWYRRHGYDFLALTDHNRRFDPRRYARAERPGFVLIAGEEVTMAAEGLPVHVNALCTTETVGGQRFSHRTEALHWAVDRIRAQGGIPLVNHPNFYFALDVEHLATLHGPLLLEVWSGHPQSASDGDAEHPPVESQWDALLSMGRPISAVAVDDMHHLRPTPARDTPPALPGTGWVAVYGAALSREGICEALADGRFYASSGPMLERLMVGPRHLQLCPADPDAQIAFLGADGTVLGTARTESSPVPLSPPRHDADSLEPPPRPGAVTVQGRCARYDLAGHETFVRARVTTGNGRRAWTQAYRVVHGS